METISNEALAAARAKLDAAESRRENILLFHIANGVNIESRTVQIDDALVALALSGLNGNRQDTIGHQFAQRRQLAELCRGNGGLCGVELCCSSVGGNWTHCQADFPAVR